MADKSRMPTKEAALPGRPHKMPVPDAHFVNGAPLAGAVSRRPPACAVRAGLFLGGGAEVLAAAGRLHDRGRLRRRLHAEPDLPRSVLRHDRPQRGRARGVRSAQDLVRQPAQGVLGEPQSDPGHAAGQRRRHPVPLGDLLLRRVAARHRGALARHVPGAAAPPPATDRSPPRSCRRRSSITPRTITSSTSPRIPAATAGSGARALPVRWGSRCIEGSGFKVQGSRFGVQGSGFTGCTVQGAGCTVQGARCRVHRVHGAGFTGFRVTGFRVPRAVSALGCSGHPAGGAAVCGAQAPGSCRPWHGAPPLAVPQDVLPG